MVKRPKRNSVDFVYTPNTILYLNVIIIFVIIRFVPFSSGLVDLDEALNDLTVGATASACVAWLIDIADCNKRNKERTKKA